MIFNRTGGGGSTKPASLSFVSQYGGSTDTVYATFSKPDDPSQDGYVFGGWYSDSSFTKEYDWEAPAKSSTVYAKWSIAQPDVNESTGLIYNGSSQELGYVTATGDGQTVEYSLDGSSWSESVPTGINAGDYTVHWRVSADGCDTISGTFSVSIRKASCGITIDPTFLTVKEGEGDGIIKVTRFGDGAITASSAMPDLCDVLVSGTTVTVSYKNAGSALVMIFVAETDNYSAGTMNCQVALQSALEIVSWSSGTDEQIAAMVAAADAGQINLSDYWKAGDTRTVHLSAMSGSVSNANESHAAQDVQMVLTDPGHYTLANGKKCNFVVLQKDCLKEYGVMNSQGTNSGGWNNCPRRTWCNSVYRNAIPSTLRGIFKQFTTYAANGTGSSSVASSDYFALFSEKEVFGSITYANSSAEANNSQLTWFKTSSNRIKRVNGSASGWWERSPYSGGSSRFCTVHTGGSATWGNASGAGGLAPFGCI